MQQIKNSGWSPTGVGGVSVVTHGREVHMYQVTDDELDGLCNTGNLKTLGLTMFALCVGAALTIYITIKTVDIKDPITHAEFTSGLLVAVIGAVFFAGMTLIEWNRSKKTLKRIRKS
jgi:hypothetical protein